MLWIASDILAHFSRRSIVMQSDRVNNNTFEMG